MAVSIARGAGRDPTEISPHFAADSQTLLGVLPVIHVTNVLQATARQPPDGGGPPTNTGVPVMAMSELLWGPSTTTGHR
jgi:hypothetical protein